MGLLIPYPKTARPQQRNFSGRPTTTWGTTLTSNASANTEGTTAELVASTTYDSNLMVLTFHGMHVSATVTDALVNVKIGASFEYTIVPNLIVGFCATDTAAGPRRYLIPVSIPRGTRVGASVRALIGGDVVYCQIELVNTGDGWSGAAVECLGANTAASRGTSITPGTTSDGSWTSIGTSTRPYKAVLLAMGGNADTTQTATLLAGDIGTGSALLAGLENFAWTMSATEWVNPHDEKFRPCQIPSGTALQARVQGHTTDAESKTVCIYGVY